MEILVFVSILTIAVSIVMIVKFFQATEDIKKIRKSVCVEVKEMSIKTEDSVNDPKVLSELIEKINSKKQNEEIVEASSFIQPEISEGEKIVGMGVIIISVFLLIIMVSFAIASSH